VPPRWTDRARNGAPHGITGLALLVFALESWRLRPQIDDAYISYRYARNLAEGLGLVYNAGEHVEGFTNLLWTLLVSLGIRLGFEAPSVGHALGLASGAAALVATYAYAATALPASRRWLAALAPWILLACTPFPAWATSGLETPLFLAAATAALAFQARDRMGWAAGALAIATLTRPEGALLAVLLFGVHAVAVRRLKRSDLRAGLAYLAVPIGLTVFRLAYYGDPLPNTFYAKVGGIPMESGLAYLGSFLGEGVVLLIPAALVAAGDRRFWPGLAWVAGLAVYVVWIGGDAFGQWRFLLPCVPVLAALSVRGVERASAATPWAGVALGLTIPGALVWFLFGGAPGGASFDISRRADSLDRIADGNRGFEEIGRRRARVLAARPETPRLVATGAIGSFGYYSRLPIVDYLGIVDPVVAHSPASTSLPEARRLPGHHRSNADYVLSRRPDYILVPDKSRGGLRFGRAGAILDIWAHPDFEAGYAWDDELRGYRSRALGRVLPPNLVLIIGDDQGFGDYGFMGSKRIETPTLDRLAREGVVFPVGYSTASLCQPALNALLTGLDPVQWQGRLEAREREGRARPRWTEVQDFQTLPRLLARRGYASFQAGKHWEGTYKTAGFDEGMTAVKKGPDDLSGGAGLALVRETIEPVTDFLDRHLNTPFFLWFAPMLPHAPHDAPERFQDIYRDAGLEPRVARYYASISQFDAGVGSLLDHLAKRDLLDRTVVVYLADNGWQAGGSYHRRNRSWGGAAGKNSLYELGLRTPIVFHGPGRIPTGQLRSALVSILDIFPTLLDYAGAESPSDRPGRSLRSLLEGRDDRGRSVLVGRMNRVRADTPTGRWIEPNRKGMTEGGRFARDARWHYLWYLDREHELYDLDADPDEQQNVAAAHPEVVKRLRHEIERWEQSLAKLEAR
jgi:uncharacterized sulfatase